MDIRCKHCKNIFATYPSVLAKGHTKYCSTRCYAEYRKTPSYIKKRFWSFVDVRGDDECWPWLAGFYDSGYGQFTYKRKKKYIKVKASRFAWRLTKGKIPKGLLVCHSCDNPPCCNPNHFFLGTYKDNSHDSMNKKRHTYGVFHPGAKIGDTEVVKIFKLRSLGYSQSSIGEVVGLSQTHIGRILRRERWSHIDL